MTNQIRAIAITLFLLVFMAIGIGVTTDIPEAFALQQSMDNDTPFDIPTVYERLEVKSGEIYFPETIENCSFKVDIENKTHHYKITIKGPSGSSYSTEEQGGITERNGCYNITIPQAEKGAWTCEVTGFEIGKVRVEAGETRDYIQIDNLSYNRDKETINWQLSYVIGEVHFQVAAVTAAGKVLIKEFSSGKTEGTTILKETDIPQGATAIELTVRDKISIPDAHRLSL